MLSKFIQRLRASRGEEGQAMVMAALSMVVILGFAAFAVDVGHLTVQKSDLQNAADAAALAGVADMPSSANAVATALNYAKINGMAVTANNVTLNGEKVTATAIGTKQLKVECSREVEYYFAGVLGFTSKVVTAVAVAEKSPQWAGEALPFINLDDNYATDPKIVAWEKTGPGDFESLWPDEYTMFNMGKTDDHSKAYFTIDYTDGITITKGTVATIKQEVGYIYAQHKPLYIFSLSSDAIKSGKYNNVKNKDVIPLSDLVLLQVTFDSYDGTGKTLFLTVTGVYDINNGVFPSDFLNGGSTGSARLIQ
jgi:Flp pilus assembly protein TadG